ncbi:MAG TPA: YggT family protein [Candidatus Moranbacteria bacterium]|nr:YggT family protein [Candidatus Moranbacteria bacterium]
MDREFQHYDRGSRSRPLYRGTRAVWYIAGILETILAFRFALKLLGANPAAGFTRFIYALSEPFVAPFLNVFGISRVERSIFEWPTLLAMFVYWLIALGIAKLLIMSRPVSDEEAERKLDREDQR